MNNDFSCHRGLVVSRSYHFRSTSQHRPSSDKRELITKEDYQLWRWFVNDTGEWRISRSSMYTTSFVFKDFLKEGTFQSIGGRRKQVLGGLRWMQTVISQDRVWWQTQITQILATPSEPLLRLPPTLFNIAYDDEMDCNEADKNLSHMHC